MSKNCLKNTVLNEMCFIAAGNFTDDSVINEFFKSHTYLFWLEQHKDAIFTCIACTYYKNGDMNGRILQNPVDKSYWFERRAGFCILSDKKLLDKFKELYFNSIEKFDEEFVKYFQDTLLQRYAI